MEEVIDFKNPEYGNRLIWAWIADGETEPMSLRQDVLYKARNGTGFFGMKVTDPMPIDALWYAWDCVARSYRKDQLGITLYDTKGVVLNWGDLMAEVYDLQSRHEVLWTLLCELALIAKASK